MPSTMARPSGPARSAASQSSRMCGGGPPRCSARPIAAMSEHPGSDCAGGGARQRPVFRPGQPGGLGTGDGAVQGPAPDDRPASAGPPGVGMARVAVTCAFAAMAGSGPSPRHRRAAAQAGRGPVAILRGWPVRAEQSGAVSGLTVPLPVWPCPRAWCPWLRTGPGSDGLSQAPGAVGMAWRERRWPGCQYPAGSR